ncbi:type III restriction protein res subunit [Synechococcus sp. 63AY4M2]|uniref:BPTD_3080 family restriction endonuclease n=1 Tax=unclassified Synechococcus TaxID=2626047 RepID=UPI000069437D|nr:MULTISPECIES: DEAD/DEAH box helicase family protein [unclassified Synechococcus]ABC99474.1 putative type III restriction-modification system, Res subunit [Synechococcus sp. JA-3-3Ab]PIK85221.1 type III restriction protein res subunit [Synechococcus sp. 63AY4M2]PIK92898.1 type III restriction protein res subunit [Synechococcus sp. 65AY6Li]
MARTTIDRLIINSPYEEPKKHWRYDRETRTFELVEGQRPAGYVVATPGSKSFDDPGIFVEIPLVNQIRLRVKAWREAGYPGITSITRRLLAHWHDPEEFDRRRFFFCQLEAVETLIWLTEAPAAERVGIEIPGDGGDFDRRCCKMATGTGKTIVMAMVIAWHILNKVANPQDARFSKNVLVVAPGLTVKKRLAVLEPAGAGNYYEAFDIVPSTLLDKLRQGRVLVRNWHALAWESEEQIKKRKSVDKRGAKSDEAYTREVLGEMANAHNLLVINDEAHHAWRVNWEAEGKYLRQRDLKDSAQEATVWVGGLDRLHRSRGILTCYDFSATPFAPSGKKSSEEALFGWIVSDFGLNDAIESGLVKTPRVVVRDDAVPNAKTYKSRLYHIYNDPEVKDDLNRRANPEELLPDLVLNAYYLLGYDWRETWKAWKAADLPTPPVMITVCNRTETAARVKHAFESRRIPIDELCNSEGILHIDSKVLEEAEAKEEFTAVVEASDEADDGEEEDVPVECRLTKAEQAERLRKIVDTVGQVGQPGEKIQNVISVGMLSEGWDAKTVTHIMGLRAFTSQLLCEQVVGRGLRRTSYEINPQTGLLEPEYVNIFGVPFTFLPHEDSGDGPPPPPTPKTAVEPDPAKAEFEIRWPNVVRIERLLQPTLTLDWSKVQPLELDAAQTPQVAELAPILEGKPDVNQISRIELEKLAREFRTQRIIFETARNVFDQVRQSWRGSREILLAQLVRIVEQFIRSDRILISPPLFYQDELRRRLIITLNLSRVVQHVCEAVRQENTEKLVPVFDRDHPIRSTGQMRTWYTSKPCERTRKSHINVCVYDSTWEASDAFVLDNSSAVSAWAKNDHLGFEVLYLYRGVVRKYRPDFLVRLANGDMLILETKGQDTELDRVKRRYLDEWVQAVNAHGAFGRWRWKVARYPGEIRDTLLQS